MAEDHFGKIRRGFRGIPAMVFSLVALSSVWGQVPAEQTQPVYLHEDAAITGKQMCSFSSDGEAVTVVLGEFSLTIGRRKLSGSDGVLWIRERRLGRQVLRDIQVYIEGDATRPAEVVEPDGTTTRDRLLFVVLRQQGALRARVGAHSRRAVETLPVYRRAVAMRKGLTSRPATRPGETPAPEPPKAAPRRYEPVAYTADSTSSRVIDDPRDPKLKVRITVAKGNVHISQGSSDSDLFLEIRSDAAVLYSDPLGEEKPNEGMVIAAYLEGDVVLRRGERSVQGTRLFYDFRTGRAMICQPVFRTIQE